ncbi:MAG: ABC transporter permease [Thermodesulfobacteriota bacterium]|nr:ABC transporter permease [Thermodesulfobacteriota bacterium]
MNFFVILEKELRSYFSSLIAYIILAVFLVTSGYFFYTDLMFFVVFAGRSTTEGLWLFFFNDVRFVMLFVTPLLTMRLFAEEKKLGTIELLSTYPLRDIEILLGKWVACVIVFALMLGLTFLYPILLNFVHKVPLTPLLSGYCGLFLLGCAFISCGILISSLTENQIVAAVVTLGVLVLFWFISWNEGMGGELLVNVLIHLSLFDRFYNFARGIIDTKDVIFFLIFSFFFLFLSLKSLESARWRGLR